MKLYLLRHGEAVERGDPRYPDDAARPLTARGHKRTRQLANALERWGVSFDVILSSPLIRARQTAEIVARRLKLEKRLRLTEALSPEGAYGDLVAQLERLRPRPEAVLLVGHEPHLSGLISLLCTGGPGLAVQLKKGGLCRLEVESLKAGRCATLEWLLSPRHGAPRGKRAKR
ncbi:MAG: phosphohistidine phosphatase SixA [Verrucomicrobiae bacterium]|nr:phosphohistidine phosphatase SixA [Verrucomicrobiae bacterium]